jgi:hypothetical protein
MLQVESKNLTSPLYILFPFHELKDLPQDNYY